MEIAQTTAIITNFQTPFFRLFMCFLSYIHVSWILYDKNYSICIGCYTISLFLSSSSSSSWLYYSSFSYHCRFKAFCSIVLLHVFVCVFMRLYKYVCMFVHMYYFFSELFVLRFLFFNIFFTTLYLYSFALKILFLFIFIQSIYRFQVHSQQSNFRYTIHGYIRITIYLCNLTEIDIERLFYSLI